MQRHVGGFLRQGVNQFKEALQGAGRASGKRFFLQQLAARLPQRQLAVARGLTHHVQRAVANPAGRRVDHAFKRRVVVTVGNQTQIRERIFDFLTFEEAHTAVNAVRHPHLQQRLFQHARLGVAAIENGTLLQRAAVVLPGFDAVDHEARFVELVEGAVNRNRFAVDAVGPQLFTQTPVVILNQGVGRAQNVAG